MISLVISAAGDPDLLAATIRSAAAGPPAARGLPAREVPSRDQVRREVARYIRRHWILDKLYLAGLVRY